MAKDKDEPKRNSWKDTITIRYDWKDGTRTRVSFPRQNMEQPRFRKIVKT